MRFDQRNYVPCIAMPPLYIGNSNNRFFGFDERKDRNGNIVCGFFVDVETYDEKHVVTILCKPHVHCILWTDEHGRIEEATVMRQQNHPEIPAALTLLVENSDLKEWFLYNSGGIFDGSRDIIKHYQIWSTEDCIDVLCEKEPMLFEEMKFEYE